jgi:hypothetical protein
MGNSMGEKFQLIGEICVQHPRTDTDPHSGAPTVFLGKLHSDIVLSDLFETLFEGIALRRANCKSAAHFDL